MCYIVSDGTRSLMIYGGTAYETMRLPYDMELLLFARERERVTGENKSSVPRLVARHSTARWQVWTVHSSKGLRMPGHF